jgi:hypothetical protein
MKYLGVRVRVRVRVGDGFAFNHLTMKYLGILSSQAK